MKHTHKFELKYVNALTCCRGLLWECYCGTCLSISEKEPTFKEASVAFLSHINKLEDIIDDTYYDSEFS